MGVFESEEYQEIIQSLEYFGFEKMDSSIYLTLLEFGPSTMSDLAGKLDVDRGKIYRSMEKLEKLGVVKLQNSKVTLCEAIKPEEALMMLIEKKKTLVADLKRSATELSEELNTITRPVVSQNPSFSVIEGRNSIYNRIGKLIQDAKNPVYLVTTTDDLLRMMNTAIPEKIKLCQKNNTEIRILVDVDGKQLSDVIKLLAISELRIGRLPSKSRIVVEKENQLIMSGLIKNTESLTEESESILYSNSNEMTENMYSLCEQLWKSTKNVLATKTKS